MSEFTTIDARALVEALEANRPQEKDVAYEFSNGRKFERSNPVYDEES